MELGSDENDEKSKEMAYIVTYYNFNDSIKFIKTVLWFIIIANVLLFVSIFKNRFRYEKSLIRSVERLSVALDRITEKNINSRINISKADDELKILVQKFNLLMDRIESSYQSQKLFVSFASHELRTPIAVIDGYANLLNRWGKDDPAVLAESIEAIKNESLHMQHLIEKLLFISRAQGGKLDKKKSKIDIVPFISTILKELEMVDKKHEYECDHYKSSLNMYADPNYLRQAIRILLENSMKYSPENSKISIYTRESEGYIQIEIKDNGKGIEKKDKKKIFESFSKI